MSRSRKKTKVSGREVRLADQRVAEMNIKVGMLVRAKVGGVMRVKGDKKLYGIVLGVPAKITSHSLCIIKWLSLGGSWQLACVPGLEFEVVE